jgi:hypothetical protein
MARTLFVVVFGVLLLTFSPAWPGCSIARADHVPCCRYCSKGKACGNSCIARNRNCNVGHGCACDAGTYSNEIAFMPHYDPIPQ